MRFYRSQSDFLFLWRDFRCPLAHITLSSGLVVQKIFRIALRVFIPFLGSLAGTFFCRAHVRTIEMLS